MTIKRPSSGWRIQGVTTHPGTVLKEDFLKPMEISANQLALRTRMPATRVGQILHARRGVSVDTALRLARYFGTSAEFWLNLQAAYDLSKARLELDGVIQRDVEPLGLEASRQRSPFRYREPGMRRAWCSPCGAGYPPRSGWRRGLTPR